MNTRPRPPAQAPTPGIARSQLASEPAPARSRRANSGVRFNCLLAWCLSLALALLVGLSLVASDRLAAGSGTPAPSRNTGDAEDALTGAKNAEAEVTEAEVRVTCGVTCHKFPPSDILPRASWRNEIRLMAQLRDERSRPFNPDAAAAAAPSTSTQISPSSAAARLSPPLPEDMKRALEYYERTAPVRLPPPEPWPPIEDAASNTGASPRLKFVKHFFAPEGGPPTPAVSNVHFADLDGDARLELLGTDMRHGIVFLLRPYAPNEPMRLIAQIPAPSHVEVVDLDRDGLNDLLVADLGEFSPGDHLKGAAIWLRGILATATNASASPATRLGFEHHTIGHLPRAADVEAADLDEDGRLDVVIAAFGWHRVGELMWLRNISGDTKSRSSTATSSATDTTGPNDSNTLFAPPLTLDPRPGAIHVIPADINHDGHIDIVSVIAQEHEEVIALLNDGHGNFEKKSIYSAPHPNWGSSGIQVVDLDRDGDLDVLLTHGDMFDDLVIKPYHGIQWLENRGTFPFTPHTLCSLPGVHRAIAADLDRDGDLDIIASALIPEGIDPKLQTELPSLVWLEQTSPGTFIRHTLERGTARHPTLDAADYDGDGDVDLVVGNMVAATPSRAWVEVWENVTPTPRPQATPAILPPNADSRRARPFPQQTASRLASKMEPTPTFQGRQPRMLPGERSKRSKQKAEGRFKTADGWLCDRGRLASVR